MKIEEIEDSQESEEEYKKIDEFVKKKVREENIIKTPEAQPKLENSLDLPTQLELSHGTSNTDRNDLIKQNRSTEEVLEKLEKESKNLIKKEVLSNNKILSMLNQSKEIKQYESKSLEISRTNNSLIDERIHSQLLTKTNEMTIIQMNKEKISNEIVKEFPSQDNIILMDESVNEKRSQNKKKTLRKTQKKSKSKKIYEAIEPNSIMESISNQNDVPNLTKDLIFGEKIESQYERLKKVSPFGNFNTFKLFKVIIKNGEDLRQEQFATQLINEFYQIFQLEEVDIWLKPYEILSTGHNVGLIECVPNSVSLDYLKRKSKDMNTLCQFYQTYFGPHNTESNNIIYY